MSLLISVVARASRRFAVVGAWTVLASGALRLGAPMARATGPAFVLQNEPKRPEPFRESRLQLNPPTFRWPVGTETAATYRIELARDPSFTHPRTELVHDLWFRPLEPLDAGVWYWRCRPETPQAGAWLGTESFEISADLARWPVPPWTELLARISSTHPRVYLHREELPALRANAQRLRAQLNPRVREVREKLAADFSLASYEARVPPGTNPKTEENLPRRSLIRASKSAAMDGATPAAEGAWLWVATGDRSFIEPVKRRALLLASFDPRGFITDRITSTDSANIDFGNALLVHDLGLIYDLLYDEFTAAERQQIRAAIVARAEPIFAKVRLSSQQLMRAHAWQHGFIDAMVGALAIYGEEPATVAWVESGLKAFVALYPWFGGNDGGSQEGTRYFHSQEMLPSLNTLDVFRASFNLRLEEGNPWFRANPYFLIYSFPPGGSFAGLGDSHSGPDDGNDYVPEPGGRARLAALHMAELYHNGHAAAYAAALPPDTTDFSVSEILRWSVAPTTVPTALTTLPAARAFRDIGAVYAHSALARPEDNVRLVFHSSPYGGHGHSHADQNSFHVIAYGEELLLDSGYYTAVDPATPHRLQWAVQTKAHNTILVDGLGQSWGDTRGYGRISHFEEHDDWVYMVGSAENAYPDAPLERFDRHLVWLRGANTQTYVIVDEIASANGVSRRFDWLLHAANRMDIDESARKITVHGVKGEASVALLEPSTLAFHQDDQFDAGAVYWQGGQTHPLPNQWHLRATPPAARGARFVAVVQVSRPGVAVAPLRPIAGGVEIAGWHVQLQPNEHLLYVQKLP